MHLNPTIATLATSAGVVQGLLLGPKSALAQALSIIPKPVQLTQQSGSLALDKDTRIFVDPKNDEFRKIGEYLAKSKEMTGVQLAVVLATQLENKQVPIPSYWMNNERIPDINDAVRDYYT